MIRVLVLIVLLSAWSFRLEAETAVEKPIRIGFGSCVATHEAAIWSKLEEESFSRFFFLGDNLYLPPRNLTPKDINAVYTKHFANKTFLSFLKSTKITALWDDHDFSPLNDGDSSYPEAKASESIFRKFWKSPPRPDGFTKGIHHSFVEDDVQYIVTDNRSFRRNIDRLSPTYFGKRQLDWLIQQLDREDVIAHIILSGGQLLTFGGYHEHLGQYPSDYKIFVETLGRTKKPVFIISGDRHYGEVLSVPIGKKTVYELTSSPLFSGMANDYAIYEDKHRKAIYTKTPNYGVLTLWKTGGEGPKKLLKMAAKLRSSVVKEEVSYEISFN